MNKSKVDIDNKLLKKAQKKAQQETDFKHTFRSTVEYIIKKYIGGK